MGIVIQLSFSVLYLINMSLHQILSVKFILKKIQYELTSDMEVLTTRYLEIHEPITHEELRATLRESYQTRPMEPDREDSVEHGVVTVSIASVLNDHEDLKQQFHENRTLNLSLVSSDVESEILETFTSFDDMMDIVRKWIKLGVNPTVALDYYMVRVKGLSQKEWADDRGVTSQAVSQNISIAEEGFDSSVQSLLDISERTESS